MASSFKKAKVKLDLLAVIDMLLMVKKHITEEICNSIYKYAKANNKYISYNSYIQFYELNNLYGWAMSQKLPKNNFEWIKNTSQGDEGCFLEIDAQYPEKLHELHNDLPFLPKRMNIEKVEKLVANLHDKTDYVIHIRNLKQAWISF